MRIEPEVGCSKPAIIRREVVLPQPDGPSSDRNSPWYTSRSTSSTATTSVPNRLVTPRNWTSTGRAGTPGSLPVKRSGWDDTPSERTPIPSPSVVPRATRPCARGVLAYSSLRAIRNYPAGTLRIPEDGRGGSVLNQLDEIDRGIIAAL